MYKFLNDFAQARQQRNWSVITRICFISIFEHRDHFGNFQ